MPWWISSAMDEGRLRECKSFWVREEEASSRTSRPIAESMTFLEISTCRTSSMSRASGAVRSHHQSGVHAASRGCPHCSCTFCSNTLTKPLYQGLGKNFRMRSVENLIQEMEYAMTLCKGIKVVRFDDEVFPIRKAWIDEFAEKWPARVGLPFEVLVDPRMVAYEPLEKLKRAGLRAICMGIQANDRVNQEFYNRNTTNQQILDSQEVFRRVGIVSNLQIIWDDPYSTEEDKDELFRMVMELERPFELYLFGLTIYPNTHLARRLLREGLIQESDTRGSPCLSSFVDLYLDPKRAMAGALGAANKSFLKSFIWKLYHSERFKNDPTKLVQFAQAVNLVKMAGVADR